MLTRFEKARLTGARALKLSMGAPAAGKPKKGSRTLEIVKSELEAKTVPISVIRTMPDGTQTTVDVEGKENKKE